MSRSLGALALFVSAAVAQPATAQGFVYRSGGYGVARFGPGGVVAFRGGFVSGGYFYNPYGVTSVRQVTVVYSPPLYVPPPIVITQPPVVIEVHPPRRDPDRPAPPPPPPDPPPDPPLPGRAAGVFRPLEADNRARAERPLAPRPPKPEVQPERPLPPVARELPADEAERLIAVGNSAFAVQEYGRAAEHFARALSERPRDARAAFLLGQALFALGKYRAALDAIEMGLRLRGDWAQMHFNPRESYGPPPTDYAEHLRRLEQTLARHPDDPVLLFLYGYELWLDSRRDEARPYLERARRHGAPAAAVDRFIDPAPAGRVL